ncbi:hypothetical protein KCU59_g139, partial [Aureobasidium melanogenum]
MNDMNSIHKASSRLDKSQTSKDWTRSDISVASRSLIASTTPHCIHSWTLSTILGPSGRFWARVVGAVVVRVKEWGDVWGSRPGEACGNGQGVQAKLATQQIVICCFLIRVLYRAIRAKSKRGGEITTLTIRTTHS